MSGETVVATKTDVDALFEQVKKSPDDETLLGAYADALDEADDHQTAVLARKLRLLQRQSRALRKAVAKLEETHLEAARLQFLLRLAEINVGDFLAADAEGRVFPVPSANRAVGQALRYPVNGVVRATVCNGLGIYADVEVAKMGTDDV